MNYEKLRLPAKKRDISWSAVLLAIKAPNPEKSLKGLGFSFQEIGDCFGLTRQAISLRVGAGSKPAKNISTFRPNGREEELRHKIYAEAVLDTSWWPSGRLDKSRFISVFEAKGFSQRAARKIYESHPVSKLDVILYNRGVPIDLKAKVAWFEARLSEGFSQTQIYMDLNSLALKIPPSTFLRQWNELLKD